MLALPVGGQPLPLNLLHGHECHLSLSSVLAEQVHRSHRHLEERAARGCGGAGCPQVHRAHLPRPPRGRGPRKRIVRHDVILPWTPPNQKARAEPHLPFSFCQIVAYLEQPREAQVRRRRPVRAGIQTPAGAGSIHGGSEGKVPVDGGPRARHCAARPGLPTASGPAGESRVPSCLRVREARWHVLGPAGRHRHPFPAPPAWGPPGKSLKPQLVAKGQNPGGQQGCRV